MSVAARSQMTLAGESHATLLGAGSTGLAKSHHNVAAATMAGMYSSRLLVVGAENCTSLLLGTPLPENKVNINGRLRQWTESAQSFGIHEVTINERTVSCPTSKRNLRKMAQSTLNAAKKDGEAPPSALPSRAKFSKLELDDDKKPSVAALNNKEKDDEAKNAESTAPQTAPTQQQLQTQLIHAKSTTLNGVMPGLTMELFEISENDVAILASDQLFGPYALQNIAGVVVVVDCANLFPTAPNCSVLIESVETVIQQNERKRKEYYQKKQQIISSVFIDPNYEPDKEANAIAELEVPTLCQVLETYRSRQDAAAEKAILETAERIQALRQALDNWAGAGGPAIPIHVALHNTETVAPRLEAWSLTNAWAKLSDASRAKVLSKLPKREPGEDSALKPVQIPSLQSCCAPEPFVQPHLSLHRSYPLVSGTQRAIRGVLNQIVNRANGTLFFPSFCSLQDQTPIALLSSIVSRPQVYPNSQHLQEIVHSFKNRCFFRRVFVIEPRTLISVASDRPFARFITGIARSEKDKDSMAAALASHSSPVAHAPGVDSSFSNCASFTQDYLAVVDAIKLSTAFALTVHDDFASEATQIKASFAKEEQGEILMSVAEGGLASWRGSLELTNGEGVYLYGLAPPVNLLLGCIGNCVEVQRMQSLIEFNLHVVQGTVSSLVEETMKRARAAGYAS